MITLKDYQERVLDSLREFFRVAAHTRNPATAFGEVTRRIFGEAIPYLPVSVTGLNAQMPYVCLPVPTGGGKTLLACYAAGLAQRNFLRAEHAVVLWLVPSNTILNQTADALRDPRHPYRRALELACGAVEVMTIEEALHLSRAAVEGQTVVIVSTIQSFRVEDTTGRKVYGQNGAFADHLLQLPADRLADLLPGADGKPKPSLVNMLRLRRPIVIVDEAHNVRTDLSCSTLGNAAFLHCRIHGDAGARKEPVERAAPCVGSGVENSCDGQVAATGHHAASKPARATAFRCADVACRSRKSCHSRRAADDRIYPAYSLDPG